jgi:hypothetical protein
MASMLSLLIIKFRPMGDDLLACSDLRTGTIYLRPDAPRHLVYQAFLRELDKLMGHWTDEAPRDLAEAAPVLIKPPGLNRTQPELADNVIQLRRTADGVG